MNESSRGCLRLGVVFVLCFPAVSFAQLGFGSVPWIDDSSLSIIDGVNETYTHAVDFANSGDPQDTVTSPGSLTINGLTFDSANMDAGFNDPADDAGHTWTGSDYVVDLQVRAGDGGINPFSWGDGSVTANGGNTTLTGTDSEALATGITAGGSLEITLSGLTQNTDYTFVWFSPLWNQAGGSRNGTIEVSFDDFASIEDTSFFINQDGDGEPSPPGAGIDQIIGYGYNTGSNTSVSFRTSNNTGDTLHNYAFLNQVGLIDDFEPILLGDADKDGDVDMDDFFLISDNFLSVPSSPGMDGDIVIDNIVDAADFRLWKNEFNALQSGSSIASIPEPAAVCLLGLGLLTAFSIRLSRR